MSMGVDVILTVPHSVCLYRDYARLDHMCDLAAATAANEIKRLLERRHIKSIIVPATINRRFDDLNRISSRIHRVDFRETIDELIKKNKGTLKLVLDVHSYNADYEAWEDYEIAVLDDRKLDRKLESYHMVDWLRKNGVTATLVQGIDNDIQDEMHEKGIESYLIEFNESLLNEEGQASNVLTNIASLVAQRIKQHLEE